MIPALIAGGSKVVQGVFTASAALGPVLLIGIAAQHVHYEGWPIFGGGVIEKLEDRAEGWEHVAALWKDAHAKQVTHFKVAKAAGERAAAAARSDYYEAARRADHAEQEIDDLRAAARRYAERVRVQDPRARRSDPGSAAETGSSPDRDGPGDDAELYGVFVSRNDFDILVENSLRLERVWRWGNELIDLDRAAPVDLPEPDFAP